MTAWPWTAGDCHGGSYLSERAVSLLFGQLQYPARDDATEREAPPRLRDRMMMMGGGGGGGMGTLQSLLSEMSGLKKPRGLFNTYEGYFSKISNELAPGDIDPERHATALHEACHAVVAYRCKVHLEIDLATIEKGGNYLGMVSYIRPEDRFSEWRSEHETDIMTSLASLAGERFFFAGDSTSGVAGDLESATTFASLMEGYWGMGSTIASHSVSRRLGTGGGPGPAEGAEMLHGSLGGRIEGKLAELYQRTQGVIEQNRLEILAVTHALEYHKTLDGEDVVAVIEGRQGRSIDGRVYRSERFAEVFCAYHDHHVAAHVDHGKVSIPLPKPYGWAPELVEAPVTGNGLSHLPAGGLEGVVAVPELPGHNEVP